MRGFKPNEALVWGVHRTIYEEPVPAVMHCFLFMHKQHASGPTSVLLYATSMHQRRRVVN